MRALRATLVVALSLTFAALPKPAAAGGTFTAVASGDWTDAATWGGLTPPFSTGRNDFVEILAGITVTIPPATTVDDAGTILNRGALVIGGTLNVQKFLTNTINSRVTINAGGMMNVTGTDVPVIVQNAGATFINHGTLSFGPGGQLTNQVGSLLENDGTFSVTGNATINNNDVSHIRNDAGGTITNASPFFQQQGQLDNSGSFTNEVGGTFSNRGGVTSFGSITNHGVFDVLQGGVASFGSVSNDGTLTSWSNNAFLNLNGASFTNHRGGVVIARGAITSIVNQGYLLNENGAQFQVWSSFLNQHATFDNHGLLSTQTFVATLTNDGGGVINNFADGTISNYQFGTIENGDDAQGFGTINSYGVFNNAGQVHVNRGFVQLYAPGAMTNSVGGRITIDGASTFFIVNSGVTLTNAKFGSITNGSLLETAFGGTIQNHGSIASAATGSLLNIGSVFNYCADGATVTGPVSANPVQMVGCTTTFTQTGIPSATWGVTANGTRFAGSGPSIAVNGLTGTVNYSYDASIFSGDTRYDCAGACTGSVQVGGSASAQYTTSYRVRYRATGCPLPVGVASEQWVQAGATPSFAFPTSVFSNDDPTSIICVFQSDDRSNVFGPATVTGTYRTLYLLIVNNGASGSMQYYGQGTSVSLTADVVPGAIFIDWQVDDTQYPPFVSSITVTMDAPHTASAIYVAPAQAVQSLVDTVNGMGLANGRAQSLSAKLNAAVAAIGRGQYNVATNQLNAFLNEVRAQTGKSITAPQAGILADAAANLVATLASLPPSR